MRLTIVRDGKPREVDAPVRTDGNFVVPFLAGKYPRYFIYGPMVFMPASQELLHVLTDVSFTSRLIEIKSPLLARGMDHPAFDGEEIVTLGCRLLPHKTSKGYELSPFSVVSRVNGTAVRNLSQAVELLARCQGRVPHHRAGRGQPAAGLSAQRGAPRHRRRPFRRSGAQAVFRRSGERLASGETVGRERSAATTQGGGYRCFRESRRRISRFSRPVHHAEAILEHDMGSAVAELEGVLLDAMIPVEELVRGGGGEV